MRFGNLLPKLPASYQARKAPKQSYQYLIRVHSNLRLICCYFHVSVIRWRDVDFA